MVCESFKVKVSLLLQSFLIFNNFKHVQFHESGFIKLPFFKFDGDIIQAIAVPNVFHCCWRCDRLPACLSLNIADRPDEDGLYECQLLTTCTANKYSGLIKTSKDYHHYTRLTEVCMDNKCLNGGTCEAVEYGDFQCRCPEGFKGKLCAVKTYKWHKTNTSPVCFGAKTSSFGRFYINQSGSVKGIKLVYVKGYVAAGNRIDARSKWGSGNDKQLYTIITNSSNQRILPQDEFITNYNILSYLLPYSNYNSEELIFKNFTSPMVVTAGQEYRIWYGEDLTNYGEYDNEGTTCAEVYVLALFD
ncbi:uncharacterized protein LOC116308398 [Actinia tenebrosa]|uniref:Uncharacterized protein LOC116308398 n=1 Tax=Actinia tenebrosa TaxID=6105 RepID=A0A6P8JA96_ACTTE|nr:uncharacterized protein LOC116308398 [Actinia tenebrosa]XP_031574668.1 uncharacterized protein LOC116308398 [Actinia tenebrosa]